jgi:hypothetical protein
MPIREKYDLELIPIGIAGKKLGSYRITNRDTFVTNLGQKEEDVFNTKALCSWITT